jgi:hypothetical protein
LSILLILHAAGVSTAFINLQSWTVAVVADLAFVVFLAVKRTGVEAFTVGRVLSEAAEVFAAPLVLAASLIYGSIKFKKWLLF